MILPTFKIIFTKGIRYTNKLGNTFHIKTLKKGFIRTTDCITWYVNISDLYCEQLFAIRSIRSQTTPNKGRYKTVMMYPLARFGAYHV